MAKKTRRTAPDDSAPSRRRRRRSPEEIISDLQAEIKRVRDRQRARDAKQSPAVKASFSAIRAIDKGLDAAAEEGDTALRHALADARRALASHLENLGLKLPKANLPKGPRPK